MKKTLLSMLILASSLVYNQTNAQGIGQGKVIIDAFYGFPNLFSALVKSTYTKSDITELKVSNVGPLGLTAEYLISDKVGIGAEFTYGNTTAKYKYHDPSDGNTYSYNVKYVRWRMLPRINIHLGQSEKVDPYVSVGMGYGDFKGTITTDDTNQDGAKGVKSPIKFSYRIGLGTRYFITDNIGVMAEFGIGGPLVRGGLALKF